MKWLSRWGLSILFLSLLGLTGCSPGFGLSSQVHSIVVYSRALNKPMKVDVYLPPNYDKRIRYPVAYLFHGKAGNANSWMSGDFGLNAVSIDQDATRMIENGTLRPVILVSPEMDNSYGLNSSAATEAIAGYNRGQYESYVIDDLVPYVDQHYSTIANRSGRYLGGFSMGGFIALHDAFLHPNLFSKVGVMSAALWVGGVPQELAWLYPTPALMEARDPISIAQLHPIQGIRVEVLEGSADPFLFADRTLDKTLVRTKVPVIYHEYPGGHDYAFWSSHASELLSFFAGVPRE